MLYGRLQKGSPRRSAVTAAGREVSHALHHHAWITALLLQSLTCGVDQCLPVCRRCLASGAVPCDVAQRLEHHLCCVALAMQALQPILLQVVVRAAQHGHYEC